MDSESTHADTFVFEKENSAMTENEGRADADVHRPQKSPRQNILLISGNFAKVFWSSRA